MTKKEAEEYFTAEIGDCPFKVFYCYAIAGLYENKKDNPGRLLVIWSEEDKAFSFFLTNHEVFMPANFSEELEKLKEVDNANSNTCI